MLWDLDLRRQHLPGNSSTTGRTEGFPTELRYTWRDFFLSDLVKWMLSLVVRWSGGGGFYCRGSKGQRSRKHRDTWRWLSKRVFLMEFPYVGGRRHPSPPHGRARDFTKADEVKEQLRARGVVVDSASGTSRGEEEGRGWKVGRGLGSGGGGLDVSKLPRKKSKLPCHSKETQSGK